MKRYLLLAALLATATTAQAADWSTEKGDRWTGAYIGGAVSAASVDPDGYTIGWASQIGYDIQVGNLVLGVLVDGGISYWEADIGYLGSIDGTMAQIAGLGRAGYSFDNLLFYGIGGVGHTILEWEGYKIGEDTSWVAGAGIEWAVSDNISIKAETLYWDSLKGTQGRVGINYRF